MNDDIREAVRIELAKRNWRQKDLAEETGLSKQYLSQMLSGKAGSLPGSWEKVLETLKLRLVVARDE